MKQKHQQVQHSLMIILWGGGLFKSGVRRDAAESRDFARKTAKPPSPRNNKTIIKKALCWVQCFPERNLNIIFEKVRLHAYDRLSKLLESCPPISHSCSSSHLTKALIDLMGIFHTIFFHHYQAACSAHRIIYIMNYHAFHITLQLPILRSCRHCFSAVGTTTPHFVNPLLSQAFAF